MNQIQLWSEVFKLSYGNTWQPIPDNIKRQLNLNSRLGIMGGIICTSHSGKYAQEFINRLNKIGDN